MIQKYNIRFFLIDDKFSHEDARDFTWRHDNVFFFSHWKKEKT